jgi:type III secretion protein U
MSKDDDSADKTEKPTKKRLRDARKKGDVPKSKELTSNLLVLAWLLLLGGLMPYALLQVGRLQDAVFNAVRSRQQAGVLVGLGLDAAGVVVQLTTIALLAAVAVALLVEFLQAGPVLAMEKLKPDMNRMNPVEGIKRMFSQENMVELVKSIVKTTVVGAIVTLVLFSYLREIMKLATAPVGMIGAMYWRVTVVAGAWIVFVFVFVAALDVLYQRFAFEKKLRMSRRDIRQELKDDEGDPYVRARRKQMHQEWSQRNMQEAVKSATAVVTNPTHIAVALRYEPGETMVPVVVAKGEDHMAQLIRQMAADAGVPTMENVPLARSLHERVEVDDYVPADTFEAVAQVLMWAADVRARAGGIDD